MEHLKEIPEKSVHCVVTSPPYWGLRDYGTAKWEGGDPNCDHNPQKPDGGERADRTLPLGRGGVFKDTCGKCGAIRKDNQIGLEKTPEEYVAKMVEVFREVKRVLRDDGTLWLNLGDSYWGSGNASGHTEETKNLGAKTSDYGATKGHSQQKHDSLKPKDLVGIPWRIAFALQADGWYLRSDIIWSKPNPMPESVTDRPTKAHEYVFLLTKKAKYYYDADSVKEKSTWYEERPSGMERNGSQYRDKVKGKYDESKSYGGGGTSFKGHSGNFKADGTPISGTTRNRRTVWEITTQPTPEAHFATFPEALVEPCIKAGCPLGGVVLDPFGGSGTVGLVARNLKRDAVLIELNSDYVKIMRKKLRLNEQLEV